MGEVNIVYCVKCGYYGTGEEFTVPAGWDDYEGQCPKCYANEKYLGDIDTEQEAIDELNKLYANIISLSKELDHIKMFNNILL